MYKYQYEVLSEIEQFIPGMVYIVDTTLISAMVFLYYSTSMLKYSGTVKRVWEQSSGEV